MPTNSFKITFALDSGNPAPLPTNYTYDTDTKLFGGMAVNWQNFPFDFATYANDQSNGDSIQAALLNGGRWEGRIAATDPAFTLGPLGPLYSFQGAGGQDRVAAGTFTVAQTSAPEPPGNLRVVS